MAGHCYLSDGIYRYCLPAYFECLGFANAEFASAGLKFLTVWREWSVLVSKFGGSCQNSSNGIKTVKLLNSLIA